MGNQVFAPGQKPKAENIRSRVPPSVMRQVFGAVNLEGVQKSNANAETIVLQALRDGQTEGLKRLPELFSQRGKPTVFVQRGFDEAMLWLQLNEHMMQKHMRTLVDKVRGHSSFLTDEQKDQLCALIKGCRAAYTKMLCQHNVVQWGRGPRDCQEVFVEPQAL